MGLSGSVSNNNKVIAIVGIVFFAFAISEIASTIQRQNRVTASQHQQRSHQDKYNISTTNDGDTVNSASYFTSMDAEFQWDKFMVPGYDYQKNYDGDTTTNGNNSLISATKRDTERKLLELKSKGARYGSLRGRKQSAIPASSNS